MNEKKYTLDELTEEINKALNGVEYTTTDSRHSKELSSRRIRNLASKGLISKPFKEGRNVYYTEMHLKELLDFRQLQSKGLTDKSMLSFKSESPELNGVEDQSLNDLINSMKENSGISTDTLGDSLSSSADLNSKSLIGTLSSYCSSPKNEPESPKEILDDLLMDSIEKDVTDIHLRSVSATNSIFPESKLPEENWDEYKLSENTILRIRSNAELEDLDTLISTLKIVKKQRQNKRGI